MARSAPPEALLNLRSAQSVQDQVSALRRLKNDLIGHDQRKEACIKHGIVGLLVELLNGALRSGGKRRRVSLNGNGNGQANTPAVHERKSSLEERWGDDDELRLQCTIVVGSLAQGGLAYVTPLVAGGITQPLLSALSPKETPIRLIGASLKSLLVCAEALSDDIQLTGRSLATTFADQLYCPSDVGVFAEILSQSASSVQVEDQKSLAAQLITAACRTPSHQSALLRAGVLDLMAAELASAAAAIAEKPRPDQPIDLAHLPLSPFYLADVLEAISAIVIHSAYRTARLVYSPSIVGIFPIMKPQSAIATGPLFDTTASNKQHTDSGSVDRLLPQLNNAPPKAETSFSKAFPALGSFASEYARSERPFVEIASNLAVKPPTPTRTTSQEFGTQLVSWLLYISRMTIGMDRLAAVWLLTLIMSAKDKLFPEVAYAEVGPTRNRDRTLSYLLVPLVVRMIDEANESVKQTPSDAASLIVRERAICVLGMLVADSATLQKSAVDAGAIKLLCQILKKTFDEIPDRRRPLWTPAPASVEASNARNEVAVSTELGVSGLSVEVIHALRCRAGAMDALSLLGQFDDNFRKQMIENGIVACMVDSLTPYPTSAHASCAEPVSNADALDGKKGNPTMVLIAACNFARALSRSVNILRTSLIDGGLAKPVLDLLTHPSLNVGQAATKVMCNLVLHFSPMRDELINGGCVTTLCQHAHSADSELQLWSLWSLKHLANSAPNDVKIKILDELGPGWLIQTMSAELRDPTTALLKGSTSRSTTPIGLGTPNAVGERVDLLNTPDDAAMNIDSSSSEDEVDDEEMNDSITLLNLPRYLPHNPTSSRPLNAQYKARLKLIKRDEQDPNVLASKSEVRIQEQALDFLRNLIGDPQSEQSTMVEHILTTFEPQRLFDILLSKLRAPITTQPTQQLDQPQQRRLPQPHGKHPALTTPGSRFTHNVASPLASPYSSASQRATSPGPTTQTPPDILLSTLFILVHIANGRSSQRTLLLSQTPLLHATLPLFMHSDRRIRVACVWLAQNLVWLDSNSSEDRYSAEMRARKLREVGVEERVGRCLGDDDLDVKERAKGVVDSFERLLGTGHGDEGERDSRERGVMASYGRGLNIAARAWER